MLLLLFRAASFSAFSALFTFSLHQTFLYHTLSHHMHVYRKMMFREGKKQGEQAVSNRIVFEFFSRSGFKFVLLLLLLLLLLSLCV